MTCTQTDALAGVTDQKIIFQQEHSTMPGLLIHEVSREDGSLVRSFDEYSETAKCVRRPFTGFPQRKIAITRRSTGLETNANFIDR
ncbi:MAG TPA: hypothetical protein VGU01_05880 [Sphingomicrobium sp.]|nr:hypothetical protein [Sphingomicrobium sp.]